MDMFQFFPHYCYALFIICILYIGMEQIPQHSYTCLLYTSFYGSAMAIFLLRQHFKSIPKALAEAAKIDGANTWQTIWGVYMPCAKPAYLSFAVISVSYHWNNYLWPLIVTNSPTNLSLIHI